MNKKIIFKLKACLPLVFWIKSIDRFLYKFHATMDKNLGSRHALIRL
ncbi:hypothetical protein EJK48_1334 [Moraxella catarrhalis]|nr:hypothetical protein EJK48_1334 [Moraxella catarrhalis]RUO12473.1 hypothetical protein EJK49_0447 [Moraxella catarrhalis]